MNQFNRIAHTIRRNIDNFYEIWFRIKPIIAAEIERGLCAVPYFGVMRCYAVSRSEIDALKRFKYYTIENPAGKN